MSCDGTMIGLPLAGDSTLFVDIIRTRASSWASRLSGNVHGHLVAVEVGVERGADQRVQLDRLALDQHRLEGLDAEAVQGGRAVEEHRVLADDLVEDVPDLRALLLDQLLRLLDGRAEALGVEARVDERLEELERHLLRQAALVQLQLRAGHDHRAAGEVDALAEQVLPEAALLALEHVGERLQRPLVGAGDDPAAAAVVEERVDQLLQHPLLVADDDVGRAQLDQPLQAVVAVDDAAVEVVEVGRGEAAAVERHQRAQLGRDHRDHGEDHPLGRLPNSRKISTSFSRLMIFFGFSSPVASARSARSCSASASRSMAASISRIASAPMPARKASSPNWS